MTIPPVTTQAPAQANERPIELPSIPPNRPTLAIRPKYMRLDYWCRYSGLTRSATYELLGEGKLKGIKVGKARLIDVDASIAYLESLEA